MADALAHHRLVEGEDLLLLLLLAPEQHEHIFGRQRRAEEHLDHEGVAQVGGGRRLAGPALELAAARLGDLIHLAVGPRLLHFDVLLEPALLFERLERRIDLAQLGAPEVLDRRIEELLQLVARHRLIRQQAQECVLQRHTATSRTPSIRRACVTLPKRPSRSSRRRR